MFATLPRLAKRSPGLPGDPLWWAPAAAFLALLAASSARLWGGLWQEEAYSHGPLILAVVLWLFWRAPRPAPVQPSALEQAGGWALLVPGLAAYVVGHWIGIPFVDMLALVPVAAGLLLITGGRAWLRACGFALLFLLLLVPLPDFVLEAATGSLKGRISQATELLLYTAGYPIGRNGVVLTIGPYQLLVADACSGLNSIFALGALGLLYVHLMGWRSKLRNAILLAATVPIAVGANLLRVLLLVLLTYHAGEQVGQGFLHGFAGMFLFVVSLLMLFALDRALGHVPAIRRSEAGS